jgi:hypothetical protein
MRKLTLTLAAAAVVLGTAFAPTQPAQAKSIGEIAESALNAINRRSGFNNPYGGGYYGGNPYYGQQFGYNNNPYFNNGYNPYVNNGYNPYFNQNRSIGSRLKDAIRYGGIRSIVNRIF